MGYVRYQNPPPYSHNENRPSIPQKNLNWIALIKDNSSYIHGVDHLPKWKGWRQDNKNISDNYDQNFKGIFIKGF